MSAALFTLDTLLCAAIAWAAGSLLGLMKAGARMSSTPPLTTWRTEIFGLLVGGLWAFLAGAVFTATAKLFLARFGVTENPAVAAAVGPAAFFWGPRLPGLFDSAADRLDRLIKGATP